MSSKPRIGIWSLSFSVLAILMGFGVWIAQHILDPEYSDIYDLVFTLVIFGWLTVFVMYAARHPTRGQLFLAIGSLPPAVVAVIYTLLSFPIFVPPLIAMILAIATVESARP